MSDKFKQGLDDAIDTPQIPSADSVFGATVPFVPRRQRGGIVAAPDGSMQIGHFTLKPTGLVADAQATPEEWEQVGSVLQRLEGSIQWLIGDWFLYAERQWGSTYEAVAHATGYSYDTLKDYAYVARNVELSVRTDKLSFGHHKLVASLEPNAQAEALQWAVDQNASISQFRKALNPDAPTPPSTPMQKVGDNIEKLRKEFKKVDRSQRREMIDMLENLLRDWREG